MEHYSSNLLSICNNIREYVSLPFSLNGKTPEIFTVVIIWLWITKSLENRSVLKNRWNCLSNGIRSHNLFPMRETFSPILGEERYINNMITLWEVNTIMPILNSIADCQRYIYIYTHGYTHVYTWYIYIYIQGFSFDKFMLVNKNMLWRK